MDEKKLRELLPGSGDLKEIIEEVLEPAGLDDEGVVITDEEAKEILDGIIKWILGED